MYGRALKKIFNVLHEILNVPSTMVSFSALIDASLDLVEFTSISRYSPSLVIPTPIMIKIRIKFRKYGVMRFIGHLDIMRYFQKAMRRAEIDICYSEGFSPHQIMSFAAPLGVGITSDGEYLDIEVNSTRSSEASIKSRFIPFFKEKVIVRRCNHGHCCFRIVRQLYILCDFHTFHHGIHQCLNRRFA